MPLSVHDEFRKPPMRSRSTKSRGSGLAYSSTRLSINEIGVSVRAEYSHQKMPLNPANSGCFRTSWWRVSSTWAKSSPAFSIWCLTSRPSSGLERLYS